jgi:putative N-acetylmannosamine-6-phosphate epimerase
MNPLQNWYLSGISFFPGGSVMSELLRQLHQRLIVSCQPVSGGPLDRPEITAAFARAALCGGAAGVRIEGIANIRAVRAAISSPIIGIIKRDLPDSPVRITPLEEDVQAIMEAGADIIAIDATLRPRPVELGRLFELVKHSGKLVMADLSSEPEAWKALELGADLLATTLSGYTGDSVPSEPDLDLVSRLARMPAPVIAEGRLRTPEQCRAALEAGAHSVVVGTVLTRIEMEVARFAEGLHP